VWDPASSGKHGKAAGDAGHGTSAVAACVVGTGACGVEEISYTDGKVVCLSANALL